MQWSGTPYLLALLLAAAAAFALAPLAWRRRPSPGARELALMLLAAAIWALAYGLELAATELPAKLIWYRLKFVAVAIVPLAWCFFALAYTGRAGWLSRRRRIALAVIPALTATVALTDQLHGLLLRGATLANSGPLRVLVLERGPWFWVHTALSYGLLFVGAIVLAVPLRRAPLPYRQQAVVALLAAALPWASNILVLARPTLVPHLDLTPFAFILSGALLLGGLLYYGLLDIVPIARDAVVEGLRDGVIVLDVLGRVADLNPAARRILGRPVGVTGRPAATVLPAPLADPRPDRPAMHEIALDVGGAQREYALTRTPLPGRNDRPVGQLLVLRDITASERRYRSLFEHNPDAVLACDLAGEVRSANPAAARITGYQVADLVGQPWGRLLVAGDGARAAARFRRAARGAALHFETVIRHRDGHRVALAVTMLPLRDEEQIAGVYLIAEDIGERRRAETALQASEAQHRALLDAIPDVMFRVRRDGTFLDYHAPHAPGQPAPDTTMAGGALRDLLPPAVADRVLAAIAAALDTGMPQALDYRLDGGNAPRDFETRLVVSGPGEVLAIVRDVTARQRGEEAQRFLAEVGALLAASLDYGATLQRVADLAVPFLADWCFVDLAEADGTPRRLAVAHADPAQAELARTLRDGYTPDPAGAVVRVLQSGQAEIFPEFTAAQVPQITRDPQRQRLLAVAAPRSALMVPLIARGRTLGVLSFTLTRPTRRYGPDDLALAEELARRAALAVDNARLYREAQEAVRARDRFLSIASHELRTPVTKILGYAELLLRAQHRPQPDTRRVERHADALVEASRHLAALTRDLLDVSRLTQGQLVLRPRPVALGTLIADVAERHREQLRADHALTVEVVATGTVMADPDRIEQVLANLLENAVKYSPRGGAIRVAVRPEGAGAVVTVRDEGIGLPAGSAGAIFDLFGRAANVAQGTIPGLGLGLYVCREIVEQHGGRIWAESAGEGRGTTVGFWLPADGPAAGQPEATAQPPLAEYDSVPPPL